MNKKKYLIGEEVKVEVHNIKAIVINMKQKQVAFWFGYNQRGIIPFDELGFDVKQMPYEIVSLFAIPFKAIVMSSEISKINNHVRIYYLSRKAYNVQTANEVQIGQIYFGTITSIAPWGMFVRIKDGLTVFVHCTEVSRSIISELHKCFKEGERIKVKIIDKKFFEGEYKFYGSRKMASDNIEPSRGDLLSVMITGEVGYFSYFCEVTPGQKGIIHVERCNEYEVGDKTYGYLTEIEENGFCLRQF